MYIFKSTTFYLHPPNSIFQPNSRTVLSSEFQHMHDRELFSRIAEGSGIAFAELYRSYVPPLAAYLQRLTHSRTAVDELIQETFLQVWLQRDKLTEVDYPKAWVFRIAANITFNFLKRELVAGKAMATIGNRLEEARNEVEEVLQLRQIKKAIERAVNQLPPQRKKIYQLSRDAGMTIPEIAEELGLSPNTVKNTLVSSLQYIRESLLREGYQIGWFLILLLIS